MYEAESTKLNYVQWQHHQFCHNGMCAYRLSGQAEYEHTML